MRATIGQCSSLRPAIPWITWMPDAKSAIHIEKTAVPSFAALLRQRSAWGTCIGMFGHNYVNYFLLTWLPFYLVGSAIFPCTRWPKSAERPTSLVRAWLSVPDGLLTE